jgi:hypothetical protein
MIYNTKCSLFLSFIYTYSQVFNMVSSCHVADVPFLSDFFQNPINHVQVATASVISARSSSKLAGRGGTITLSLTYKHTDESRGVKSGGRDSHAILTFHHFQSMMTGRIFKHLCSSGMPSGCLNGNLRTRRNFSNVRDRNVTSNSEATTSDFV